MSLNNPDSRRALRSIVQAVVALSLIGLLYWITGLLSKDAAGLHSIARGALIICGLGTLLYGAENVVRSVHFKIGPIEGGIGDEQP
jgi:hypothetical protein